MELKFRNVAACDVKVYRIDLMKFSLLKRNLGGITQINLAGIRPYHEATLKLGDGKDYRDRTHKLAAAAEGRGRLPGRLPRRQPVRQRRWCWSRRWSSTCRKKPSSGRVRTTVKDAVNDGYVPRRPRQGDRQPQRRLRLGRDRPARRVRRRRDPGHLDGDRPGRRQPLRLLPRQDGTRPAAGREGGTDARRHARRASQPAAEQQLLEGLQLGNGDILRQQEQKLKDLYQQNRKGVQAKEAY